MVRRTVRQQDMVVLYTLRYVTYLHFYIYRSVPYVVCTTIYTTISNISTLLYISQCTLQERRAVLHRTTMSYCPTNHVLLFYVCDRPTVLRRVSIMFFILRPTSYNSALRFAVSYLKPYTQKSLTVYLICLQLMFVSQNMASILTTSNGVTLVYNGGRYYKNRTTRKKIHRRCSLRSCRSPLQSNIFSNDQDVLVLSVGTHNHNTASYTQSDFKEIKHGNQVAQNFRSMRREYVK